MCQDWDVTSHPGWGCPQGCPIPAPGCPQGCSIPGQIHPRGVTSQECHIPYWDVPRNILLALGCQDGDPGDGDTPQGDITHRMLCLSGLILSGLIVPEAGMPGPPLCGSTGTIRVPATDRILSLAGSGSELEENGKNGSKKLDTMTLIKEGELLSGVKHSILGLCELGSMSAGLPAAPGVCQLTELSPQTWTSSGTALRTTSSTWWCATTAARW